MSRRKAREILPQWRWRGPVDKILRGTKAARHCPSNGPLPKRSQGWRSVKGSGFLETRDGREDSERRICLAAFVPPIAHLTLAHDSFIYTY